MAYQAIAIGTSANDHTGDSPRAGATKINANFVELYARRVYSTLSITQTDYSAASPIYLGGTWSDDGRWQVSRFVSGVLTRATVTNNGSYTTLSAAWAARGSLTYA